MKAFLEEEMKQQGIDADLERQKEELLMYEDAKELNFFDKIHHKTGATPLHVSAAKGYTRVMRSVSGHLFLTTSFCCYISIRPGLIVLNSNAKGCCCKVAPT